MWCMTLLKTILYEIISVFLHSISWSRETPIYLWGKVEICKESIPRIIWHYNKFKKCPLLSFLKKSGRETFLLFSLGLHWQPERRLPNGFRIKQTEKRHNTNKLCMRSHVTRDILMPQIVWMVHLCTNFLPWAYCVWTF